MEKLKKIWNRLLKEETGAVCVGCGLTTSGGLLIVQLQPNSGLECDNTTGLAVNLSEDACNGLEKRANGLWALCPDNETGIISNTSPQSGLLPFDGVGPSNTYDFDSPIIQIDNTLCCTVNGRISVQIGGLLAGLEPGTPVGSGGTKVTSSILVNPNGGGFGAASPDTSNIKHNNGTGVQDVDFNNTMDMNWVTILAGASLTYQARFRLFVTQGTSHFSGAVNFAFQWDLNQEACC